MAGSKEIRSKIKSVQSTRRITKAMEMVAASKMRRAQDRMRAARPYEERVRRIAAHLASANPEYRHPFLVRRKEVKGAGFIVVTTDKGLCGGLNTNVLRSVTAKMQELEQAGITLQATAIGQKGFNFLNRLGVKIISHVVHMGDVPHMHKFIGAIKVQLDAYVEGQVDVVYLAYSQFINTMVQKTRMLQLLPLPPDTVKKDSGYSWDYIYEPDSKLVLDELLVRYIEALVYQAVTESMASEQSARMVAMQAASDNAKSVIELLQLSYNKARQAAITKELSEIVGGAAAIA
ncbi:MAG: F0F1 ATP synthase subunit gamma [Magnetococcales bacterium]|nr:F0F1 ATP synthase subunit gamma [Magnetococcales bacterium]